MARSTPPSLISYTEVAYNLTTNPMVSASVSWQTNDVVIVIAGSENVGTVAVPTATGLTFASQQLNTAAATCATRVAAVVAGSSSSSAISCSGPAGGFEQGMGIWVWRGSDGIGVSVEQHTTTQTKALVPTDTHSALMWSVFDFNASAASGTIAPTPSNTRESAQQATHYTVYSADIVDQASAASVNLGVSGAPATGPFSIVGIEVLGTTPVTAPPPLVMAPPRR